MAEQTRALPPFGLLNEFYVGRSRESFVIPGEWRAPDLAGTIDQQWQQFTTNFMDLIHEVLWPKFDPAQPANPWKGKSADFMQQLTDADMGLLLDFQSRHPMEFDKPVHSQAVGPHHREFFKEEDGTQDPPGARHSAYDPTLPFRLTDKMPELFIFGLRAKRGEDLLRFKLIMQRPRPYQVAAINGHRTFTYSQAKSADTPSIPSGHSLAGTFGFGAIIERFILNRENLNPANWSALQQYAVDIGDRRVMAGVHYPSDNICSWLFTMLLANRVFRTKDVKAKLWQAISKQSFVYREVQTLISKGGGAVYEPSWNALHDAATGKLDLLPGIQNP